MQPQPGEQDEVATVRSLVGKVIVRIERVFFVYKGQVNETHGALQVSLKDGTVVLLRGGGNGQTLCVELEGWRDPFESPLSSVNEEFVAESGKWSLFDVSSSDSFKEYIGRTIRQTLFIRDLDNNLRGVEFILSDRELIYIIEWDEELVIETSDQLTGLGLHAEL